MFPREAQVAGLLFTGLAVNALYGVVLTSPTTIGAGNTTYDGQELTVRGCAVTIDGAHTFASLSIESTGTVTHTATTVSQVHSLDLAITGNLTIDSAAKIDVTARGYLQGYTYPNTTTGASTLHTGGSYGGLGAISSASYGVPNATYGDYRNPLFPGSGGAATGSGSGGGLIRLRVNGTLQVSGAILANGGAQYYNGVELNSGGSGGGIRIDAGTLTGAGSITANGETGWHGSGGGGGRIAIYCTTTNGFDVATQVRAHGGVNPNTGVRSGAPGTVYSVVGNSPGVLRISQPGLPAIAAYTPLGVAGQTVFDAERVLIAGANVRVRPRHQLTVNVQELTIYNGAVLTHPPTTPEAVFWLELNVAGTLWVGVTSRIDATACGYQRGYTAGNVTNGAATVLKGGSHGGLAYNGPNVSGTPNAVYGDFRDPRLPGSGGAAYSASRNGSGTTGGGLLRIQANCLQLDGAIRADGGTDYIGVYHESGGSGGGIWLSIGELSGTGVVSVAGGPGYHGGSGGGGRIAVYYESADSIDFDAQFTAKGGLNTANALRSAAPGTVYTKRSADPGVLRISQPPAWPTIPENYTPLGVPGQTRFEAERVVVSGTNAVVKPEHEMPLRVQSFELRRGAKLSHRTTTKTEVFTLVAFIASNLTVDATSAIDVTGLGYPEGRTLGNSSDGASTRYSGGSYGGLGGAGSSSIPNATYGDYRNPAFPGSGGAATGSGAGGGLIRITADSALIDGRVAATGGDRYYNGSEYNSGGSGGGVLLNVGTLAGTGTVSATGGVGYYKADGGGGRVAVYAWATNAMATTNISANGGLQYANNATRGQPGSVHLSQTPLVLWDDPADVVARGQERIAWSALGVVPSTVAVDITAYLNGNAYALGTACDAWGSVTWDTSSVPDGMYEIKAVFRQTNGVVLQELTRRMLVNNAVVWHAGSVTTNEVWAAGRVHAVDRTVVIETGVSNTIAPCAVVKFVDNAGIVLRTGATLQAGGTADGPVILTSLADDSAGGDANLDGALSRPLPGAWTGVRSEGTGAFLRNGFTEVRFVRMQYSGTLTASQTWRGCDLHELVGDVIVTNNITVTVAPGAIVKMGLGRQISVRAGGVFSAAGSVAEPVWFTSVRDDAVGGDTNGDGSGTTPQPGDWRALYAEGGAISLSHARLRYGGKGTGAGGVWAGGDGLVHVGAGGRVAISHAILSDALYEGIACWGGGTVGVTNAVIAATDRAVNADGATVFLSHCTLYGNRVGLWPHGGAIDLVNSIVSHSGEDEISGGALRSVRYSNLWAPARPFAGAGADGNLSTNPAYKAAATGNFRLAFQSPCIDAADGIVSPVTDLMGAPRYDDPRSANTGTMRQDGSFSDMGSYEFVETASSDMDMLATDISGPSQAQAGSTVTVTWKIRNAGTRVVDAAWHDTVLIVPSGLDWRQQAVCAEVVSSGSLGVNQSAAFSAQVRVPGGIEGPWRWAVRANSQGDVFEGGNWTNNTGVSAVSFDLSVPELTVGGGGLTRQIEAEGDTHWFKVRPLAGMDVAVELDDLSDQGANDLYLARGYVPDRMRFDARQTQHLSPDVSVLAAQTVPATYYVTALAKTVTGGPKSVRLSARALEFGVSGVDLTRVGNGGSVTIRVEGGQLRDDMLYQLISPSGTAYDAVAVYSVDSSSVFVTFNLTGAAAGAYDLAVVDAGITGLLHQATSVVAGGSPDVQYALTLPKAIRQFQSGIATIEYHNAGLVDALAPLVELVCLYGTLSLDETRGPTDTLRLLCVNREGPAGILPPGARGLFNIMFSPEQRPGDPEGPSWIFFNLNKLDQAAANLGLDKAANRPAWVDPAAWDVIWSNFSADAGTTALSLNQALADHATYLGALGERLVDDPYRLLSFMFAKADHFGEISRRYWQSPFGRGSRDPRVWLARQTRENTGEEQARVHFGGDRLRLFSRDPHFETWRPATGESASLDVVGDHFEMRELDGLRYIFATNGLLSYLEDPSGNRATCRYDALGSLLGWSNTWGRAYAYTYAPNGRISQVTDECGRTSTYEYDAAGEHLVKIVGWDGMTNLFAYADGSVAAHTHAIIAATGSDGGVTRMRYDANGRLDEVSVDGTPLRASFAFDAFGGATLSDATGPKKMVLRRRSGAPLRVADAQGRITDFRYDDNGFLAQTLYPQGIRTSARNDGYGRPLSWTGADEATFGIAYEPSFGGVAEAGPLLGAAFVGSSGLTPAATSVRPSVSIRYDAQGRAVSVTHAGADTASFGCDQRGLTTNIVNARGQTIGYAYDVHGRLLGKTLANGQELRYGYDGLGNLTSVLHSVSGAVSTNRLTYDGASRLTRIDYANGRFVGYEYDAVGRRVGLTASNGYSVRYTYDAWSRLADVSSGDTLLASFEYDAAGRIGRVLRGNGVQTSYAYDGTDAVLAIEHARTNGAVLARFEYTYDALGRVARMTTLEGEFVYGYDTMNRLTSVAAPGGRTVTYAYDAMGNRLSVTDGDTKTAYRPNFKNQYEQVGERACTHDADGNLIRIQEGGNIWTLSYDAESRLTRVEGPEGTSVYEYDAFGSRSAQIRNGLRREFLLDPTGLPYVLAEYDETGALSARYVIGYDQIARLDESGTDWYLGDAVGNTMGLADGSGALVNAYQYLPFGEMLSAVEGQPNTHRWQGQWGATDEGGNFFTLRARQYHAGFGRFLSRDPAGVSQGLNLYAYCNNHPTWSFDRTGAAEEGSYLDSAGDATDIMGAVLEFAKLDLLGNGFRYSPWIERYNTAGAGLNFVSMHVNAWQAMDAWESGDMYAFSRNTALSIANGVGVINPTFSTAITLFDWGTRGVFWVGLDWWEAGDAEEHLAWIEAQKQGRVPVIRSEDPNDITGPSGYGEESFIVIDTTMNYLIRFENKTNATAAALSVTVTNSLSDTLDWSTFELGNMGFATNHVVSVPAGRQFYSERVNARATTGLDVDISADFDPDTGRCIWRFRSVDPVTGGDPEDPFAGFLPPNTNAPAGEGWVRYSVKPKSDLADLSAIPAMASIVFDWNAPILTPEITNTIDRTHPTSSVDALPAVSARDFEVSWSGTDGLGSGIGSFDLYVSRDRAPYTLWQAGATNTSAVFTGEPGINYRFYARAHDNVGQAEPAPENHQAETLTELRLLSIQAGVSGQSIVSWESATGKLYRVLFSTNLTAGFLPGDIPLTATPPINVLTNGGALPAGFFRIQSLP